MYTKPYYKLLFILLTFFLTANAFAQTADTLKASDRAADKICEDLKLLDLKKLAPKDVTEKLEGLIGNYFATNFEELLKEFGLTELSEDAGEKVGTEIGKKLLKRCPTFMQVALAMSKDDDETEKINESKGTISKIASPDFTIITLKDATGRETQFYWLRYFKGSEKLQTAANSKLGKKVKISWTEMECYVPKANGYYKIKEIKELEFLP